MPRFIDRTGHRSGRLTALHVDRPKNGKRVRWICRCDCGALVWVDSSDFATGHTQSCGCLQREQTSRANSTHGQAKPGRVSRTYLSWQRAKSRCYNMKNKRYADYGGRGITMCDRWRDSFEAFRSDMGEAPVGKSLDRWPDVDGNYEPSNCRWADVREQAENRRNTIWVEHDGALLSLTSFAAVRGVKYKTLHRRVSRGEDPRSAADKIAENMR